MRIIPVLGVLTGPEGDCPPLPYITVDDDEGASKIARGLVLEYVEGDVPAAGPAPVVDQAASGDGVAKFDAATRAQHIADAIDLLEDEHFVKTGARAGKPKVDAIAEISGVADVSAEEIDAAIAAKEAE